jgi:hypothetical protein
MADAGRLVPGPIYGLRTWRVVRDDGRERLAAPHRATVWPAGHRWLQASCDVGHAAPAADCGCGLHAWHPRLATARRVLASRFDVPGIVEAEGPVELHADGFRAARARPYAFVLLPRRNPFLVERLSAAYGAEVLALRDPEELVAACAARHLGLSAAVVDALLGPEAVAQRRQDRRRSRRQAAARVAALAALLAALGALGAVEARSAPIVDEPGQQRHGAGQDLLLLGREALGDRPRQPALALAPLGLEHRPALAGEGDGRAAPVVGVRRPRDEAVDLEVAHRLGH